MATEYESTGSSARWYGPSRTTVIKIGPLYGEVPDLHSHDGIVDATVNAAMEEQRWFEEFWDLRIGREPSQASTPMAEAWEAFKQAKGEHHPCTLERITDFGMSLLEQQHCEEAEDLLWWAWVGREREPGANDLGVTALFGIHLLGLEYMGRGHYELAEKLLVQALRDFEAVFGEDDPHRVHVLKDLVRVYESWDKPNEATEWRSKLLEAKGVTSEERGPALKIQVTRG
ncbi:MAG: tetratricopeptide repeat protein [Planctomycetota bacterium]|nr:tetratricopeptide repeat protein [Planctomycetota bacterium]